MRPVKIIVLLENHHPQDMKLITFALRANQVHYQVFSTTAECEMYLRNQNHENQELHLLLTDTEDINFIRDISKKYPFCMNAVMIGNDLEFMFKDEQIFNSINCFIARNDPNNVYFPHQIMGALKRVLSGDFFGLRHFMHGSYTSVTKIINNSHESHNIITEISEYVLKISQNDAMATQVEGIADELIMNAMYDANPKYQHVNRDRELVLNESEKIVVNFGCDGKMFAISVTDQFGRLGKETIYNYLQRCFFEETRVNYEGSGGGLGFYRILNAVNSLVINVVPNKKTEVIGILDITLGRKAFQKIKKSFYYLKI